MLVACAHCAIRDAMREGRRGTGSLILGRVAAGSGGFTCRSGGAGLRTAIFLIKIALWRSF